MVTAILKPLSRCVVTNLKSITSISRNSPDYFANTNCLLTYQVNLVRNYAKESRDVCDGCRRALKDIPKPYDPTCPLPCKAKKIKKKGILYKIKFKMLQGGANFGTPFRKLLCKKEPEEKLEAEKPEKEQPKSLPAPKKTLVPMPEPRPGVQVSILGADTTVGQYVALLLKQCPQIKKLRLYQARAGNCGCPPGNITSPCRDMFNITQDLQHIDTNCVVQAFSCCCPLDLNLSLQNADIVLMLDDGCTSVNMPFEKRFECQAPRVKMYADAIAQECPKAMILVATAPVDCMVPVVAETLKETGWYDKRKLIGSIAVPEMRASTIAARALTLEPRCTRVPCVGGTEGLMLVPLFSKTVTYFDFDRHNAEMLTETVRMAPLDVTRWECCCLRSADLSEAHALTNLVKSVAHALLCHDVTRVSGFVETDGSQLVSPARYLGLELLLNHHGICHKYDIPPLNKLEMQLMDDAWKHIKYSVDMATEWYRCIAPQHACERQFGKRRTFLDTRPYKHLEDCISFSI